MNELSRIAGWINWALNVYPLLRPALCHVYAKMSGEYHPLKKLYINNDIRREFQWLIRHLEASDGVRILKSTDWRPESADITLFTDASLSAMSFWDPESHEGFVCDNPQFKDSSINLWESLAVVSAIHHLSLCHPQAARIVIYSDSSFVVNMFNSLKCPKRYSMLLRCAVDILISFNYQLRVLYIPTEQNLMADALSRGQFIKALTFDPDIERRTRQPIRAAWSKERLLQERAVAMGLALDTSTHKSYSSALNAYINFCNIHDFPLTPTADTLSFFVVFMSFHIKVSSVDSYLSGICNELEGFFPDVRELRRHRIVKRTLDGCRRRQALGTTRKRALTLDDLSRLIPTPAQHCQHDDILFFALVLTGFFGLLRLGELTWPEDRELRSWDKVIRRTSVSCNDVSFSFTLPGHKADRFFEGNHIIIGTNSTLNPIPYLAQYLQSRDRLFPCSPALWMKADGSIPTRNFVINRFKKFFDKSVAGHSLRAGGATFLAEMGVPHHIIQARGRWASETFQIYIRKNATVLQGLLLNEIDVSQ
ncbi:hypothetical protein ONZ45_g3460 [Pleurotus djamor]|nr:hypothetical protein ONZ45_g3460 [Pleurotus djamor]